MTHDAEHRIRERAYHLWEAAGRPHGREDEFWRQAYAAEHTTTAKTAKPAAKAKPAVAPKPAKTAKNGAAEKTAATAAPSKVKVNAKAADAKPKPRKKSA